VFLEKFNISFPVGRVEYLYLYPVDFEEYLNCLDNTAILKAYRTIPIVFCQARFPAFAA